MKRKIEFLDWIFEIDFYRNEIAKKKSQTMQCMFCPFPFGSGIVVLSGDGQVVLLSATVVV
jgi:hypothetical protein